MAHGVTSLWGAAPICPNSAKRPMVHASAISARGATHTCRHHGSVSTVDIARPHAYSMTAGIGAWDESGTTGSRARPAHGRAASPIVAVWTTRPALSVFGEGRRTRAHQRAFATPVPWHLVPLWTWPTVSCPAGTPQAMMALARRPSIPRGEASRHGGVREPRAQRFLVGREDTCDNVDISERAIHGARGACATVWWWGV
jgi:hypothetical protein